MPDARLSPPIRLIATAIAAIIGLVSVGHGETATKHWAFKPIERVAPPTVRDTTWPAGDIDRFILTRLEAAGLKPAPAADKRTLIRRATFDLIGLPPTPAEVDAFLADESPDAFANVIDRLLASPQYGERWGRHWLDVARYADSNGLDENIAHGNAWRYRDWVVAAFNSDMPFDQFVIEQLAGDQLARDEKTTDEARHAHLIATGFLSLGPKVLAEVDETKMEMDIIDEQVDTVGQAFMAVTLGCARCHDHKFDPFPMTDYYALAGIFKSTRTMEHFTKIARWFEQEIPSADEVTRKAAFDAKVAALDGRIKQLKDDIEQAKKQGAAPAAPAPPAPAGANDGASTESGAAAKTDAPAAPPAINLDEAQATLKKLTDELAEVKKSPVELSSAMSVTDGKVVDLPLHVRGSHLTLGAAVPRRFPAALSRGAPAPLSSDHSGRLELAQWLTHRDHPLTSRVIVNRIWRWHFGTGIVATTDNFGKLGEKPTHPELLNHLAASFMDDGWSIKRLHKRIMLSRTYRMSSAFDMKAAQADPTNRLHWRFDIHRLDAESIRDAMLAVSGRLDTTMGGSMLEVANRAFFFDHTSKDLTKYDSTRRSLYLPVVRNHLYDVFELLDFPASDVVHGDRPTTTVAPQAMFFMNSPLVQECAEGVVKRAWANGADDAAAMALMYRLCYGRDASAEELSRDAAFLEAFDKAATEQWPDASARREQARIALAQALLVASEFIHVR